jgi:DNA-binding SARP family transcriptional activator/tetratricopeptide (TPR) repeat protein
MDSVRSTDHGLEIRILGSPQVERDGDPVEVDTRKAIALLVYLAVTEGPHGRDALASLLWPEYDQERARAALRRTLSALKKALGGRWLTAGRGAVGLDGDEIFVDTRWFAELERRTRDHGHDGDGVCAACIAPLRAAAELYRGDFMAGFTLRDTAGFDDWQFFQSEGWRRELALVLERLARALVLAGECEDAIDHARRWLALDPLHEPAHRMLMCLYAWTDRRSAALRQFRDCVQVLERELGVSPLEETAELYRTIVGGELAAPNQTSAPPTPSSGELAPAPGFAAVAPPRVALVGRDDELGAVLDAYGSIAADGRLVVLEGEAGIGKSGLAEAVIETLGRDGAKVLTARCYEGEGALPYGPVAELLRAALGGDAGWASSVPGRWLGEAARLVPELADVRPGLEPRPDLDDPGARSRLFQGVIRVLLAAVEGPRPGVMFIDDLHWADESSLDLITFVARRLAGKPILMLGTWRPEELVRHPALQVASVDAARAGWGFTLRLRRLTESDVRKLAHASAPDLDAAFVERLFGETQGLPLFVNEYLAAAVADSDAIPWPPPRGVRDLVEARLAALSAASSQLLTAAAVIGTAFEFETVRNTSGRSDDEAVAALDELIARGLLKERALEGSDPISGYEFTHEVVRALVYEGAGFARRRLLHGRVAQALVGRARAGEAASRAGQAAHHYRAAGRDEEAARWFVVAGEEARRLYANAEALTYFDAALALGHPEAGSLHEAIGDLRTLGGDYDHAATSYQAAAARSGTGALARLEHKLGNLSQRSGDVAAAEGHYQAALASLEEGDDALRARVLADRSLSRHRRGDDHAATSLAHEALTVAEGAGDTLALAQVHNILGIVGSGDEALGHLEASLSLAEASDDPTAQVAALNNLALARGARGEHGRAVELELEALSLCSAQGDLHREAALENNLADLLHATGESEAAMPHLKRAVGLFAEVGEEPLAQPELWKLVEW